MNRTWPLFMMAFVLFCWNTYAQDEPSTAHSLTINIPEAALVDLESSSSTSIALNFSSPTEAGEPIKPPTSNADLWLNYSSTVASATVKRTITAQLNTDVQGVNILLNASNPSNGFGSLGNSLGQVSLSSTSATTIINNIGSCYTGSGSNKGAQLTYDLSIDDISAVFIGSHMVSVTYTITDDL